MNSITLISDKAAEACKPELDELDAYLANRYKAVPVRITMPYETPVLDRMDKLDSVAGPTDSVFQADLPMGIGGPFAPDGHEAVTDGIDLNCKPKSGWQWNPYLDTAGKPQVLFSTAYSGDGTRRTGYANFRQISVDGNLSEFPYIDHLAAMKTYLRAVNANNAGRYEPDLLAAWGNGFDWANPSVDELNAQFGENIVNMPEAPGGGLWSAMGNRKLLRGSFACGGLIDRMLAFGTIWDFWRSGLQIAFADFFGSRIWRSAQENCFMRGVMAQGRVLCSFWRHSQLPFSFDPLYKNSTIGETFAVNRLYPWQFVFGHPMLALPIALQNGGVKLSAAQMDAMNARIDNLTQRVGTVESKVNNSPVLPAGKQWTPIWSQNCGGLKVGNFNADSNFTVSQKSGWGAFLLPIPGAINVDKVPDVPRDVLASCWYSLGDGFDYSQGGFEKGGSYILRLLFCDPNSGPGARQIHISVNGKEITDPNNPLDPSASAGGAMIGVACELPCTADGNGLIKVSVGGKAAAISGLQVGRYTQAGTA